MKVTTTKTWETIIYEVFASKNEGELLLAKVELNINHDTGKFTLSTPNQEMVKFHDDSIQGLEAKMTCLKAAVAHIKTVKSVTKS